LCAGANADKMHTALADPNRAVPISTTHGFVVTSNKKLKNEFGLAIATNGGGQLRLCSAHAAYNIARNVRSELQSDRRASQARFEMLLPGGLLPIDDPSVEDVKRVLLDFGIAATQLYNISPRVLVNFRDGHRRRCSRLAQSHSRRLRRHPSSSHHSSSRCPLRPHRSRRSMRGQAKGCHGPRRHSRTSHHACHLAMHRLVHGF